MILHEAVVVSNRLDITDKVIKKLTGGSPVESVSVTNPLRMYAARTTNDC